MSSSRRSTVSARRSTRGASDSATLRSARTKAIAAKQRHLQQQHQSAIEPTDTPSDGQDGKKVLLKRKSSRNVMSASGDVNANKTTYRRAFSEATGAIPQDSRTIRRKSSTTRDILDEIKHDEASTENVTPLKANSVKDGVPASTESKTSMPIRPLHAWTEERACEVSKCIQY